MRFTRLFATAALAILSSVTAAHAVSVVNTDTTFTFTGVCAQGDLCVGTGIGTLVVQNYIPNTELGDANFVSFTYSSNYIDPPFVSDPTASDFSFDATLTSTPGPDDVTLVDDGYTFTSSTDGSWSLTYDSGWNRGVNTPTNGVNPPILADYGTTSSYALAATPEPDSIILLGTGLAGLLGLRRRKR